MNALREALQDYIELRRRMGAVGYERVRRHYTYEQLLTAYDNVYKQEREVTR